VNTSVILAAFRLLLLPASMPPYFRFLVSPVALLVSFVAQQLISHGSTFLNMFFPKYERKGIDNLVQEQLGNSLVTIYQLRNPPPGEKKKYLLVPSYKIGKGPVVFGEYSRKGTFHGDHLNLKHIAKATSAAPTFFPSYEILEKDVYNYETGQVYVGTYVDGGIVANNPSMLAYLQALELDPHRPILLVSIGTGKFDSDKSSVQPDGGALDWVNTIIKVGLNSEDTHQKLQKLFNASKFLYYRINIDLDKEFELDNVASVEILYKKTQDWIGRNSKEIENLAKLLLNPEEFDGKRYMIF